MQHRVRRAISRITEVIGFRTRKLILWMKARDLDFTIEIEKPQRLVGHGQKIVVILKVLQCLRVD